MTTPKLDQAREWAESVGNIEGLMPGPRAAAEVIQSLPDQWIDVEKVRELLDRWEADPSLTWDEAVILNDVEALLAPSLPTLAELIEAGNDPQKYQWMQAMFTKSNHEHVITCIFANRSRLMRRADGMVFEVPNDEIIPLSGEPKMEWPGSHANTITAESVEDVQAGRVADFEPALPRPEDVPAGEAWLIRYEGKEYISVKAGSIYDSKPWVIHLKSQGDYWWVRENDITLVSRLVPEVAP